VEIREDGRFVCSHAEFADWAKGRKQLRMEFFYREMRRKTGLLMEGEKPVGDAWNFDADNRKSLPDDVVVPERLAFEPDDITRTVMDLVASRFGKHFGDLEPFLFAVTRKDALKALDHFITDCLPSFGDYQDAMKQGEPLLFHGLIGAYINSGLLDPLECCARAEAAWRDGHAPLNASEGFIRQIIGWREYVRGIYWLKMPDYAETNALNANRRLPDFYWTGDTEMNCIRQCVQDTRRNAYAHHIQRLMVTGNFALLAGISPAEIEEWYLCVYADAYDWVELPNTHGMVMFADGGLLASKPYAASGAYIDRMSDYCQNCAYDVKTKIGENACPFNILYWNFVAENRDVLKSNQRMRMIYSSLEKMNQERVKQIQAEAGAFLDKVAPTLR
jgi:deoxyribodipyrimidine photolyase-related protein